MFRLRQMLPRSSFNNSFLTKYSMFSTTRTPPYKEYLYQFSKNSHNRKTVLTAMTAIYQESNELIEKGEMHIPEDLIRKSVVLKQNDMYEMIVYSDRHDDPQTKWCLGNNPVGRMEFGMLDPTDEIIRQGVIAEFGYTKMHGGDEEIIILKGEIEQKYQQLLEIERDIPQELIMKLIILKKNEMQEVGGRWTQDEPQDKRSKFLALSYLSTIGTTNTTDDNIRKRVIAEYLHTKKYGDLGKMITHTESAYQLWLQKGSATDEIIDSGITPRSF